MPVAVRLRRVRFREEMTIELPKLDQAFIPYGRHVIEQDDCDAVIVALKSANLTQGRAVNLFEDELARISGAHHACAVTNGTAALHLAVKALAPEPGSFAITTPITFAASANALLYNNLKPVFTEVDEATGLMSMDSCEAILRKLAAEGKNVSVVVPVHFSGAVCDMDRLWHLSAAFGFNIVEDASHALGARYANGNPVGSDARTSFTTISFHPVKHIATGEGGVILSNNAKLQDKVSQLRSHGILRDGDRFLNRTEAFDAETGEVNPWYYEMQDLGFNYRMPDINAALGYSQARKFDRFLRSRI
jgi:dTDP-4-amino-4,6-dideoxygalactose transaminase